MYNFDLKIIFDSFLSNTSVINDLFTNYYENGDLESCKKIDELLNYRIKKFIENDRIPLIEKIETLNLNIYKNLKDYINTFSLENFKRMNIEFIKCNFKECTKNIKNINILQSVCFNLTGYKNLEEFRKEVFKDDEEDTEIKINILFAEYNDDTSFVNLYLDYSNDNLTKDEFESVMFNMVKRKNLSTIESLYNCTMSYFIYWNSDIDERRKISSEIIDVIKKSLIKKSINKTLCHSFILLVDDLLYLNYIKTDETIFKFNEPIDIKYIKKTFNNQQDAIKKIATELLKYDKEIGFTYSNLDNFILEILKLYLDEIEITKTNEFKKYVTKLTI